VVDAQILKKELSQLKFNLVLHGHKHYPYYCEDTTFEDGSTESLAIISSGTMGGKTPTGECYSFNILEVHNKNSGLPKVLLTRKEFDSTGFEKTKKYLKEPVKLKRTKLSDSEIAAESLSKVLSGTAPIEFYKKMSKIQQSYEDRNPIQVEHYNIRYDIFWTGKETGDHLAHHVVKFKNLDKTYLDGIFLSLTVQKLPNVLI
jgi:hypothetical protein